MSNKSIWVLSLLGFSAVSVISYADSGDMNPPKHRIVESSSGSFTGGPQRATPAPDDSDIVYPNFNDAILFKPALEVRGTGSALVNGIVVDPSLFPANLFSIQMNSACTSTLVGPNVVLTAAHCVDYKDPSNPARTRAMTIRSEGVTLEYSCEMHPDYASGLLLADSPRNSKDVAMCILESATDRNSGREIADLDAMWGRNETFFSKMAFENIALDQPIAVGDDILIGGYGCQVVRRDDGHYYTRDPAGREKFRVGATKVSRYLSGRSERMQGSSTLAMFYSESDADDNIPDLCQGDSGGSVFHDMEMTDIEDSSFDRKIIAVNSGISLRFDEDGYISHMTSVYADLTQTEVKDWILSWGDTHQAKICGVNVTGGKCRRVSADGGDQGEVHDHPHTHEIHHSHEHSHEH